MAPDQHHNGKHPTRVAECFSQVVGSKTNAVHHGLRRQVELKQSCARAEETASDGHGTIDKIFTIIAAAAMQQQAAGGNVSASAAVEVAPKQDSNLASVVKQNQICSGADERRPIHAATNVPSSSDPGNTDATLNRSSAPLMESRIDRSNSSSSSTSDATSTLLKSKTSRQLQQPKEKKDLRKGKWTPEEEEYASRIIYFYQNGILQLPEGVTLRSYLAERLNCDPMRITKKIAGASCCLGKRVPPFGGRAQASPREVSLAKAELEQLEERFKLRQKLGNCNLPLQIWPELYKQRSQTDVASTLISTSETDSTLESVPVVEQPQAFPSSCYPQTAIDTNSSTWNRNFGISAIDESASSANLMSKFFQSYLALQAASTSATGNSTSTGGGEGGTTTVAPPQPPMLPQYHQQQQMLDKESSIDTNAFTKQLLASMFPNLSSPTFGTANCTNVSSLSSSSNSNTATLGPQSTYLQMPNQHANEEVKLTTNTSSAAPAVHSPPMYPASSQTAIPGNNSTWINQGPVPTTPMYPNLPFLSGLPTPQGNSNSDGSVFAQSMAWANIAQFTHTLFQLAAANSQSCFQQQQQNQQHSPWINSWPFNSMPSIPSTSSHGMLPNTTLTNNLVPQHVQPQLATAQQQQQQQQQPQANLSSQFQPPHPSVPTSQAQQLHPEKTQVDNVQSDDQTHIKKSYPCLVPLNQQNVVERNIHQHSDRKIENAAPSLPKESKVIPKKMCKEDEDASNTLLGFISSLRENYDKALVQNKQEDELKSGSETVVHEEDNSLTALQRNFQKALAQNKAEEERYRVSDNSTTSLTALQNNFHRVMAQTQQLEEKEWARKATVEKSNNLNYVTSRRSYPCLGQDFADVNYSHTQRDASTDQSTATFVSRSSDGHFWKKASGKASTPTESLKVPIGRSLKAISLVSNQASDISDHSEKSAMKASSSNWNASSKSSSTATAEDFCHGRENMFHSDISGDSVSSCESTVDPSSVDLTKDEYTAYRYGCTKKTMKRRRKLQSEFTSKNVADHTTLMDSLESAKRFKSLW